MVDTTQRFTPDFTAATADNSYYALTMFPYPSGAGLHAGHASVFTINDVAARFQRMQGKTVFNPFGFDSFGLPTENYAMKQGRPAYEVTEENKAHFLRQIDALNMSFDYERMLTTSQADYYKRTQWIFSKLYEAGLVYRDELRVNRCTDCQTMLANAQVEDGKCERCGNEVVQKKMPQWFIKITDYADRLIADLDLVDRPTETKTAQKNWIGRSEGAEISFEVVSRHSEGGTTEESGGSIQDSSLSSEGQAQTIKCFTTRPDTIYGVTAVVLAPENTDFDGLLTPEKLQLVEEYRQTTLAKTAVQRQQDAKEKTGLASGFFVKHPLINEQIPVRYADYVLADYGSGAVMMVPAHDERDFEFAKKYGIEIKQVIAPKYIGKGDLKPNGDVETLDRRVIDAIIHNDKGNFLLMKDTHWHFVGGGVEEGDSIEETVVKEIKEETGYVNIEIKKVVLDHFYAYGYRETKNLNQNVETTIFLVKVLDEEKVLCEVDEGKHSIQRFPKEKVSQTIGRRHHSIMRDIFNTGSYSGPGILVNSGEFDGLDHLTAKKKITEHLESLGKGERKITYRLRDRSVSRQRYWGSPIPVYYDKEGNTQLIPENELPVVLPLDVENYTPKGKSPLEEHPTFPHYTKKPTLLLIHGRGNTPGSDGGVLDGIVESLQDQDVNIIFPSLDYHKTFDYEATMEQLLQYDADLVVGHSSGGYLAQHYANAKSVQNIILIAPTCDTMCLDEDENRVNVWDEEFVKMVEERLGKDDAKRYIEFHSNPTLFDNIIEANTKVFFGEDDTVIPECIRAWYATNDITVLPGREHMGSLESTNSIPEINEYLLSTLSTLHSPTTYLRECDTLDTFMCSSFYFLRYPNVGDATQLIGKALADKLFPVDLYTGGKEHTVGHLLYSRFIHKFLYDQGYVSSPEPFAKLVHQGMVLGADGRKMGKRYGNGVDPLEIIEKFGADAVRTYLMFMGPVEQDKIWNESALNGVKKFLARVERLLPKTGMDMRVGDDYLMLSPDDQESAQQNVISAFHQTIIDITGDFEKLKYNTAISKIMILVNTIYENGIATHEVLLGLTKFVALFATELGDTMRVALGQTDDVQFGNRPVADESKIVISSITLPVQINGKVRANIEISPGTSEGQVMELAKAQENIQKYLEGKTVKKVIFKEDRILNIVVG